MTEEAVDLGVPLECGVDTLFLAVKPTRFCVAPSGKKNCSRSSVLVRPLAIDVNNGKQAEQEAMWK